MDKQSRTEAVAADAEQRGMPLAAAYVRQARATAKDKLATGNADATKPGKAATYAVTQEAFDAAFNAGRTYSAAYAVAGAALQPLLTPLSGSDRPEAVAQWREFQRAFCLGMAAERAIDPDSARRAFNRLTENMGLTKPQTAAAKAKQAGRAAQAGDEEASPKDGAGEAAAQAVQMGLSAMEAHLISMLRAGKFTQAAQAVADMAEAAK